MLEFFQKVAVFYSFSPEDAPFIIFLYLLPLIVILALIHVIKRFVEKIGHLLGYKTEKEQQYYRGYQNGYEQRKLESAALKATNHELSREIRTLCNRLNELQQENDELKAASVAIASCNLTVAEEDEAAAKKSAKVRRREIGVAFEKKVSDYLEQEFADWLISGEARLLHNVVLETQRSPKNAPQKMWTQIDILLLHSSGIYFIECKHWAGLIIGKSGWEKWIQIKCDFDAKRYPLLTDGLSAQYFNSPSEQVNHQRATMGQFLKELHEQDKSLDLEELPWMTGKRMIVMDHLEGDTSSVDLGSGRKDQPYLWFGYMSELADTIRDYDKQMSVDKRISRIRLERLYRQLLMYSDDEDVSASDENANLQVQGQRAEI